MAERRMFAKTIVLSDAFLDMPLGARCLYMTMSMLADDDGFVNQPKGIMRQCGASEDDLRVLIAKKFIIPFESGVIVIKHWRINNYLQSDRYKATVYTDEKNMLTLDAQNNYHLIDKAPLYTDSVYTQDSKGKVSIGKSNNKHFTPPTLEEVKAYIDERHSNVDAKQFFDYYTEGQWHDQSGKPVKNWKQKVITWEKKSDKPRFTADEMEPKEDFDIHELRRKLFGEDYEEGGNDG